MLGDGGLQGLAALASLGPGGQEPGEALFTHIFLEAIMADGDTAPVAAPSHQEFGRFPLAGGAQGLVPIADALEGVVVLGIEDQEPQGGIVHVQLMDQAIIRLPGEIP